MRRPPSKRFALALLSIFALSSGAALADEAIGQVKKAAGTISVRRGATTQAIGVGARVFQSDTLITGPDGSLGITFADDSMMSLGPNSKLSLERFRFDSTTHEGVFDASLEKGTLAVKSGLIVRQTPEAMRVRTPAALLGVRGTEFVVRADGGRE